MSRTWLLSLFILLSCASCKKDLLHWQSAVKLDAGTTHRLNRILFINDTLGFIAGGERFYYADILTTHDGGYTWQYRTYPSIGKGLYALAGNRQGDVYCVGFEGKLLRSRDYGQRWDTTYLKYEAYKGMALGHNGGLLFTGGISFDYGFIIRSDAYGSISGYDSLNYELNDIAMGTGGTGYIAAYGSVLKTVNDGATWQGLRVGKDNFKKLQVISNNEVWICGYNGSIYHTVDGGITWQRKRNGNDLTIPRYHLETICFVDAGHGYAAGEQGLVIYTDDGGEHWSKFEPFTSETLHHMALCSNGDLLVCGDSGALYRLRQK